MHVPSKRNLVVAVIALLLVGPVQAAETSGWRTGGSGVVEGATPPAYGTESARIAWKTATDNWGNASPVSFGDLICITEEPVRVSCFNKATGEKGWSADNGYEETLSGAEKQQATAIIQRLADDDKRQVVVQKEISLLQRELRRASSGADTKERYDSLMTEVNAILKRRATDSAFRLADDKGIIGYGTPTPVVSGDFIYTLFGNGVVSKFSLSGKRIWSIWLGEAIEPMLGYHNGNSASLLMVDDILLVPYVRLRGIDATSGKVVWEGPEYRHYGTPAVATVGSAHVIVTPAGDLLNPKNGFMVGPNMGEIEFVGPVAVADMVYSIGQRRENGDSTTTHAVVYQLTMDADAKVSVTVVWDRKVSEQRMYATPLVTSERIYLIYWKEGFDVLDRSTGAVVFHSDEIPGALNGSPSAVYGGGKVIMSFERGDLLTMSDGAPPEIIARESLEGHRSTVLLEGSRMYVRGFKHLYCIE